MRLIVLTFVFLYAPCAAVAGGTRDDAKKELEARVEAARAMRRYLDAPPMTKQRAAYINQVITMMVLDDLGQLKGPVDRGAIHREFYSLKVDALPQLVTAMEFAANRYGTCPTTVIGKLIENFILNGNEDYETVVLVSENLGKGLKIKDPPSAYKSLRAGTDNLLKMKHKEMEYALKVKKFDAVLELAKTLADEKAKKPAEWRFTIRYIGRQKNEPRAPDCLLESLEKAYNPVQRKAAHDALVEWAGVDHGPTTFDSPGETAAAVERWKQWRQGSPNPQKTIQRQR